MTIKEQLIRPWSQPTGITGRLAGWEMAHGKEPLNDLIAELLSLGGDEDVLEVGFGPGTTIARLARATAGRVAGADPSPAMLAQALKRNAAAARSGRIDLRLAPAERLPFGAREFDRAVAVNTVGHWRSPADGLAEIARVLRPDGQVVLVVRHQPGQVLNQLLDAGFVEARSSARRAGRSEVSVIVARRPAP